MLDYDTGPSPLRTPVYRALPCSALWTVALHGPTGTDPCVLCCPSVGLLRKPGTAGRAPKGELGLLWDLTSWRHGRPLLGSGTCPVPSLCHLGRSGSHVSKLLARPHSPVHSDAAPKPVPHALVSSSSPSLRGRVWASGRPGVLACPVRQGAMLTSPTRCTEHKIPMR